MDATLPVKRDDGTVFPVWNVSLSITQALQPDGSQPIAFALRCVPARVSPEGVETDEGRAVGLSRARIEEVTDELERAACETVRDAVVAFLRSRGL